MRLDKCIRLFSIIVLLLSIGSAVITALIVSSDTLNVVQDASNEQRNDIPSYAIPTESDKNIKHQVISESTTETINVNSNSKPNTNENNQVINSDNGGELPNLGLLQQNEQPLETVAFIESQTGAPDQEKETNFVEDCIEIDENDYDEAPSVPAISSITTGEETNELFIDSPLVEQIESVLVINNASNENQAQQSNASEIPTVNIASDNEAPKDSLELTPEEKTSTEENKNDSTIVAVPIELNLTVEENQIPVFSEWAQKRMEEVEKESEQDVVNTSTMKKNIPSPNKPQVLKLKSAKNYASPDCGAKIIAANSESTGTGYVLTSTKDEYMLSPCKSPRGVWFVVELCEAIQAERIDLANFELFSSSPKNFSIGVSNRFPTRDWTNVGKFTAKDERYIQKFDLYPHLFGKYVRVDIHSHYNSEHFCPISLFRVYGTSEFEAFETETRQHPIDDLDDDDDDEDEQESETNKSKGNIFQSASDAVMSIVDTVKKAVSVVKPNGNKTSDSGADNSMNEQNGNCITPNYPINCENCSEKMVKEVNAISACKQQLLTRLLSIAIVRNSLYKSQICSKLIGFDLNINCSEPVVGDANNTTSKQLTDMQIEYITHLFSLKYITAMCNLLAANDRKYVWNSTIPSSPEPMINVTIDKKANEILQESKSKSKSKSKSGTKNMPTDSIPESSKRPSESNENENEGIKPSAPIEELTIHVDNVKSSEQNFNSENHGNTDASGEHIDAGSAENLDQNIFNVAEPADNVIEQPPLDIPTTESESSHKNVEQATPPNVIILTEPTATPTQTTNPTEINEPTEDPTTNGWTNNQQFGQKLHSESVFLRLSNRVKALERNMSLSGQYLEELSRGYKKQVEELQSSFAKTLLNIEEQSRKNIKRKQELLEQNQMLRNELDILSERLFSWKNILIACACFTCVQIVIFHIVLMIWDRRYERSPSTKIDVNEMIENVDIAPRRRKSAGNVPAKLRRKSAEEKRERTISESSVQAIQRRPSTEALNIMGTYAELLIDDSNSSKNDSPKMEPHDADFSGYVRIEDLRNMYEKPENDYEFYGPASELKSSRSDSPDNCCDSEITLDSLLENGSPKRTKSIKNSKYKNRRRLSSPSFFKSPFSSASSAQSTGWEWHRSKKSFKSSQKNTIAKSKSESPPSTNQNGLKNNNNSSKMSPARKKTSTGDQPIIHDDSVRSTISSSCDNNSDRKTTGSFKRLLKKIF